MDEFNKTKLIFENWKKYTAAAKAVGGGDWTEEEMAQWAKTPEEQEKEAAEGAKVRQKDIDEMAAYLKSLKASVDKEYPVQPIEKVSNVGEFVAYFVAKGLLKDIEGDKDFILAGRAAATEVAAKHEGKATKKIWDYIVKTFSGAASGTGAGTIVGKAAAAAGITIAGGTTLVFLASALAGAAVGGGLSYLLAKSFKKLLTSPELLKVIGTPDNGPTKSTRTPMQALLDLDDDWQQLARQLAPEQNISKAEGRAIVSFFDKFQERLEASKLTYDTKLVEFAKVLDLDVELKLAMQELHGIYASKTEDEKGFYTSAGSKKEGAQ